MSVKLNLEGFNELRAALQALPEEMKAKADFIVTKYASIARNEIQGGYPRGPTGNLQSRVTVTANAGRRVSAVSIVKSTAPHAWIFEHGTVNRITRKGARRGKMPAAPSAEAMIPKVIRLRAQMVAELIELVESQGFEVTT